MALPFRPNCQPTSLGPLPYTDASSAWEVVLRHTPGLPALPQLERESNALARLAIEGFAGADPGGGEVVLNRAAAVRGLDTVYANYLRGTPSTQQLGTNTLPRQQTAEPSPFRRSQAIFGLVLGPVSLALSVVDDQGQPIIDSSELLDGLAKHTFLRRQLLQKTLERVGKPTIIWVYEPYLSVARAPFITLDGHELFSATDQTLGSGAPRALWLPDLATALHLPETLPFDLVAMPVPPPEAASIAAPWIKRMLGRKTAIGWGVVPVTTEGLRNTTAGRLAARFAAWLQELEATGVPREHLLAASLMMPEDTLTNLEPDEAGRALALTAELSSLIRQSYGVD